MDIVGAQVDGTQDIEGDLAIEPKALGANCGHRLAMAIHGGKLGVFVSRFVVSMN